MTDMYNPPHPGEFIKETYLEPLDLKNRFLAQQLHVYPSTIGRIINGEAAVTPEMALRLSKAFGRSPESWLQMQANFDLFHARSRVNLDEVQTIYSTNL